MTKLLEKAFNQASKLPDSSQDAIAAIVLEELEDEKKWEISFANSQESLSTLAAKVRNEIKKKKKCSNLILHPGQNDISHYERVLESF